MHTLMLSFFALSLGMVDVIFADVAQPDQTRIVALNAHNFLKNGGHFVISIKVQLWLPWQMEALHPSAHYVYKITVRLEVYVFICWIK